MPAFRDVGFRVGHVLSVLGSLCRNNLLQAMLEARDVRRDRHSVVRGGTFPPNHYSFVSAFLVDDDFHHAVDVAARAVDTIEQFNFAVGQRLDAERMPPLEALAGQLDTTVTERRVMGADVVSEAHLASGCVRSHPGLNRITDRLAEVGAVYGRRRRLCRHNRRRNRLD